MSDYTLHYIIAVWVTLIAYAAANMRSKFKSEYFYPHVVDEAPNNTLMVNYETIRIKGGTIVYLDDVRDMPVIKFSGKSDTLYTLCLASPYIPKDHHPTNYREYDQWIVINIPGGKVEKGDHLRPYGINTSYRGESVMFYVFVIYQQPHRLNFTEEPLFNQEKINDGTFYIKDFARKHHLKGPVAGNYFTLRKMKIAAMNFH